MSKWADTAPQDPVILMNLVGFTALSMAKVERFSEVCKMTSKSWRAKPGHFGVSGLISFFGHNLFDLGLLYRGV
jgi:hypothetical protein